MTDQRLIPLRLPMSALKNARHERFAQAYAVNGNASEAWRQAGGKGKNANVQGNKWVAKSDIKARIEELRSKADAKAEASTVLSILEKRQFLARVVRTPVGDIDQTSDLCQEFQFDIVGGGTRGQLKRGNADRGNEVEEPPRERLKFKMPSKLEAIKLDNDLAVDGAEAGANNALEIIIRKL